MDKRRNTYSAIATQLALLSEQGLSKLIETATPLDTGIGGTTALLIIGDTRIFIKKIRVTDVELQPENMMSTSNIFNLPTYYQYGIGSAGFGVWRELAAHMMCTHWAITGECSNFPLMYHWRLLPKSKLESPTAEALIQLERDVIFWEGSPAVRTRLESILKASAEVVLFLEYIPENLDQWLRKQMALRDSTIESACVMVEHNLQSIISFINAHHLLHFDAHFKNILTDGHRLYFADFGLALSTEFALSMAEIDFFNRHHNYDQCYTMAFLVKWILTELFGVESYDIVLHEYAAGQGRKTLMPEIAVLIKRYAPIAVMMNDFYYRLRQSKTTPYPSSSKRRINHTN